MSKTLKGDYILQNKKIDPQKMREELYQIIQDLEVKGADDRQLKNNFLMRLSDVFVGDKSDERKVWLMANLAGEIKVILMTSPLNFDFVSDYQKFRTFEKLVKIREVID